MVESEEPQEGAARSTVRAVAMRSAVVREGGRDVVRMVWAGPLLGRPDRSATEVAEDAWVDRV